MLCAVLTVEVARALDLEVAGLALDRRIAEGRAHGFGDSSGMAIENSVRRLQVDAPIAGSCADVAHSRSEEGRGWHARVQSKRMSTSRSPSLDESLPTCCLPLQYQNFSGVGPKYDPTLSRSPPFAAGRATSAARPAKAAPTLATPMRIVAAERSKLKQEMSCLLRGRIHGPARGCLARATAKKRHLVTGTPYGRKRPKKAGAV
jgi:hypothetical protein